MGSQVVFRGTSAAVVHLLVAARANGVLINRTKAAKLLYLADLEAVGRGMAPGTGVEWRWRHFGPYSDTLRLIEEDLETAGVLRVEATSNFYGSPEIRLRLLATAPQIEIDVEFGRIVESIVDQFGRLSASQLRDRAYQTPPMQAAQILGEREVRLDLSGGPPYPDLEPALARLRPLAKSMPLPSDAEGAVDELATEIEEWAPARRKASDEMLDSEQ